MPTLFDPLERDRVHAQYVRDTTPSSSLSPPFTSRDYRTRSDSQKVGLGLLSYVRGFLTVSGLCGAGVFTI